MGDGMKRAVLATLLSRGPWMVDGALLHATELEQFYAAIVAGAPAPYAALGCKATKDRKADRALQMLRKAGLIAFDRTTRTWGAT